MNDRETYEFIGGKNDGLLLVVLRTGQDGKLVTNVRTSMRCVKLLRMSREDLQEMVERGDLKPR